MFLPNLKKFPSVLRYCVYKNEMFIHTDGWTTWKHNASGHSCRRHGSKCSTFAPRCLATASLQDMYKSLSAVCAESCCSIISTLLCLIWRNLIGSSRHHLLFLLHDHFLCNLTDSSFWGEKAWECKQGDDKWLQASWSHLSDRKSHLCDYTMACWSIFFDHVLYSKQALSPLNCELSL